jgi:type I restriction enzyme S subunit
MRNTASSKKIKDYCEITSSKRIYAADYQEEGVPFFRGKEIVEKYYGATELSTKLFISPNKFEEIKSRYGVPKPGDILLTSVGTLGIPLLVNGEEDFYFKDGNLTWFKNFHNLNSSFLYYWLLSPAGKAQLQKCMIGTSQSAYTIVRLKEMDIDLPDSLIQVQIADILSAYDDLSENNRRRIQLLEQAARLLYREWFVHLRFPGHEHIKITNGVPEGWESKSFTNVLENHIGGGWGQEESVGSETTPAYVIRGTDIESVINGNFEDIGLRYHKDSALRSRLLKAGDIIFEVSGGSATQLIGRSLLISKKMIDVYNGSVICASFCKRFTPLSLSLSPYLYYHIKHIRENGELNTYIKQSASALQNFNYAAFLEHYFVRIPNKLLLDQFAEQVSLFESQIITLAMQIYSLKRARDLLLPRLMNGEIAV